MYCVKEICYGHLKNCFSLLLTTGKSDMGSKYSLICSMDFHELTLHTAQLKIFVPVNKYFAAAYEVLEVFLIALWIHEMYVAMATLCLL